MAKYIDVEELKKELICNKNFYPTIIKNALEKISPADVVEVVRCKDCVHYDAEYEICVYHTTFRMKVLGFDVVMKKNDYCNCGERRNVK